MMMILYGSETWCLRECEMAILRRTERAMVREMCGVKLAERKNSEKLMEMLGLKKSLEKLAKANGIHWYGHVLRKEEDNILRRALEFSVSGQRKRGRPKKTWRRQVEEEARRMGLTNEDAGDSQLWRERVIEIAEGIRPPSLSRTKPDLKHME